MSSVRCLFCAWSNPAGASFCNGCGTALALRPCRRCRAPLGRSVSECPECGVALALTDAWSDVRAELSAVVGTLPPAVGAFHGRRALAGTRAAAATQPRPVPTGPTRAALAGTGPSDRATGPGHLPGEAAEPIVVSGPEPEIERDVAFRFALGIVLIGCAAIVAYALQRDPGAVAPGRAAPLATAPAATPHAPAGASAGGAAPEWGGASASVPSEAMPSRTAYPVEPGPLQRPPGIPIMPAALDTARPAPVRVHGADRTDPPRQADAPSACSDAVAALGLCAARPNSSR